MLPLISVVCRVDAKEVIKDKDSDDESEEEEERESGAVIVDSDLLWHKQAEARMSHVVDKQVIRRLKHEYHPSGQSGFSTWQLHPDKPAGEWLYRQRV